MISPPPNPVLPVLDLPNHPTIELPPARFVGLDVHKDYVTVAILDIQLDVVLRPRRVDINQLEAWARQHLSVSDKVVLEDIGSAWHIVDLLQPLVDSVTVANSFKTKPMMSGKVKTDNRDAVRLARLLAVGEIQPVWVPPLEVRELRTVVAHRTRLIKQRSQIRNRLHAVLLRYNIALPSGQPFSSVNLPWWETLDLPSSERLLIRQDLALLEFLENLVKEADRELLRLSALEPWVNQLPATPIMRGVTLNSPCG